MASTYIAAAAALDAPVTVSRLAGQPVTVYSEFIFPVAPVINDVVQTIKVPKGARVIETKLGSDDLDTNGSPTITLDVGDGGDVDRYIAASTIAQTGGAPVESILKTGLGFIYTADDTIDIMVKAALSTGAVGTVRLVTTYLTP